jgi:hypothetical protein
MRALKSLLIAAVLVAIGGAAQAATIVNTTADARGWTVVHSVVQDGVNLIPTPMTMTAYSTYADNANYYERGIVYPAPGHRAAGVFENFAVYSGVLNLEAPGSGQQLAFDFDLPVLNLPGIPELMISELGGGDTVTITINGTTNSYAVNGSALGTGAVDVSRMNNLDHTSLAAWEADDDATAQPTWTSAPFGTVMIDLADFGVADGGSVGSMTINGDGNVDPALIAGFNQGVYATVEARLDDTDGDGGAESALTTTSRLVGDSSDNTKVFGTLYEFDISDPIVTAAIPDAPKIVLVADVLSNNAVADFDVLALNGENEDGAAHTADYAATTLVETISDAYLPAGSRLVVDVTDAVKADAAGDWSSFLLKLSNPVNDGNGAGNVISFVPGSARLVAVPEPGSIALLLSIVGCLLALRRRG